AAAFKESADYFDWPGRPPVTRKFKLRELTAPELARFAQGRALFGACIGCHLYEDPSEVKRRSDPIHLSERGLWSPAHVGCIRGVWSRLPFQPASVRPRWHSSLPAPHAGSRSSIDPPSVHPFIPRYAAMGSPFIWW